MNWSDVGKAVAGFAPLLGGVVGGPVGAGFGSVIAKVFGSDDNPDEVMKAIKADPEAAIKLMKIELDNKVELQGLELEKLKAVNETMKAEMQSDDPFVRRWRPFYGYCVAISWAIQMMGFTVMFVYTAIKNPSQLPTLIQQFALLSGSLVTLWGIALAVLGVSVHKISKDKEVANNAK